MLSKKALSATAGAPKLYVEDVMSTYLYSGTSATQTITNSIDLSTKGGMVWLKNRGSTSDNGIYDTTRGANNVIYANLTNAQSTLANSLTAFGTTGFTLGTDSTYNFSADTLVSRTFREQPKFFDVVTYTGQAGSTKTINHNLGSVPGCIIVKSTTQASTNWYVWHRSISTKRLILNSTAAQDDGADIFGNGTSVIQPTSTQFTVANNSEVNDTGQTYVAYLFAHDAGGFGLAGDQNVISCGSFTTDGSGTATVDLGWEPQFIIRKGSTIASNWEMYDNMRGIVAASSSQTAARLSANLSDAEGSSPQISINSTGFAITSGATSQTFIYIAIRRGPMKTPTSGTSVYEGTVRTGTGATASITGLSFPPDFVITRNRPANLNSNWAFFDKLRGTTKYLISNSTTAETTGATSLTSFNQAGETFGDSGIVNGNGDSYINYQMRRAPGFFDVVCYTGNGSARTITHNLGATPELMIVKSRSSSSYVWAVYNSSVGATKYLRLNSNIGSATESNIWNDTAPTSSVFTVGTGATVNENSGTYVAYLFASVSGVSKVGSYTGNGSSVTVTTDFQPRFILVKRTDSNGNWIVSDSARGLVSGSDPYLLLNDTAAEDTDEDWVDITSTSFTVNQTTAANANVNTGTYVYLCIA
jgi:hypothetical protein